MKKTYSYLFDILFYIVTIIILIYVLTLMNGCSWIQPKSEPIIPIENGKQILYKTVYETNWIITFMILGIGAGIFAFLNGQKFGLPIIVACFAALIINLTVIRFSNIMAVGGLIVSGGVALYSIFLKDKALKEVIVGVQKVKTKLIGANVIEDKEDFNDVLSVSQSESTQKAVKRVKAEL